MTADLGSRRWLILVSSVVSFFAVGCTFFAVPPLVPELIRRFALSHFQVGVLMGSISVPAILFSIPLGAAIDRWPARASGVGGLALMVTGGVLFALAPGFTTLLVGRLLFGVGGLIMNILVARLISSAFMGREVALAMGIFNSVYPASMIAMFTLHPRLIEALGWRTELMLLAALAAVAIPLHVMAVPRHPGRTPDRQAEAPAPAGPAAKPRADRSLWALAMSWMLFFAAYAPLVTFAPEWAGGTRSALLTVTLVNWTAMILSPVFGAIIDRRGHERSWVGGGQILLAAVLAAMALGVLPPAVAMVLVGLTVATVPTATYALPGKLVKPAHLGFAFGFITAFSNLGTLVGPALAGALRDHAQQWGVVWIALAATALVGAAAVLAVKRPAAAQGSDSQSGR